jgi:hypothetical protein
MESDPALNHDLEWIEDPARTLMQVHDEIDSYLGSSNTSVAFLAALSMRLCRDIEHHGGLAIRAFNAGRYTEHDHAVEELAKFAEAITANGHAQKEERLLESFRVLVLDVLKKAQDHIRQSLRTGTSKT